MKRCRRILFNGLSAMSFVLCLATAILWARCYKRRDVFTYRFNASKACWVESVRSGVEFVLETNTFGDVETGWQVTFPADGLPAKTHFGFGFVRYSGPFFNTNLGQSKILQINALVVPDFAILTVTALLPIYWMFRFLLRKNQAGLCVCCGYDLRATPHRCPECGKVPEAVDDKTRNSV